MCSPSAPTSRFRCSSGTSGLIPDLATLRDRAQRLGRRRFIYGMLAHGLARLGGHWQRYQTAYLLLAGLATPLVLSVHSVVSFDFRRGHGAGLALDHLSALFCRRARFTPASPWC